MNLQTLVPNPGTNHAFDIDPIKSVAHLLASALPPGLIQDEQKC